MTSNKNYLAKLFYIFFNTKYIKINIVRHKSKSESHFTILLVDIASRLLYSS